MSKEAPPVTLTSVEAALDWLAKCAGFEDKAVYRGQTRKWPLLPSLLRYKDIAPQYENRYQLEDAVFQIFKSFGHPYFNGAPPTGLDLMALAQHHGCPTRLLDWTANPLVAFFFAAEADDQQDGILWCFRDFYLSAEIEDFSPLDLLKTVGFTIVHAPIHISPRITAQAGLFTIHSNELWLRHKRLKKSEPTSLEEEIAILNKTHIRGRHPYQEFVSKASNETPKFSPPALVYGVIPAGRKEYIRRQLDQLNINRASLFPGLDGISDYVKVTIKRSIEKLP